MQEMFKNTIISKVYQKKSFSWYLSYDSPITLTDFYEMKKNNIILGKKNNFRLLIEKVSTTPKSVTKLSMENQYPRKGIQVSSEGKNFFSEETRKAPSDGNVGDPSEGR